MARVYVNQATGNDLNDGSEAFPLMTLAAAFSSPANNEIIVQDGIYPEFVDVGDFDRVRRLVVGMGDVYFNASGNASIFAGAPLRNVHVFKNIKFVNYSKWPMELAGFITFSSCFFHPFVKSGTAAFQIAAASNVTLRKCTVIGHEAIFEVSSSIPITALTISGMTNCLLFGHDFQIRRFGLVESFSTFLTEEQDKGNYYDFNIHLANGGIDSSTGENPPLFVDASGGNYDLVPSSTLVGGGHLGSDIGSFHDFTPFNISTDELFTVFDAGWQNDNEYYNLVTQSVGTAGPPDAAPVIQITLDDQPRWVLDIASVPGGKSGRLISPVVDMIIPREITRASWAAEEDTTLGAGSNKVLNNSNGAVPDLEIRMDTAPFGETDASPTWMSFDRATSLGITAQYVQIRAVFRLDGA